MVEFFAGLSFIVLIFCFVFYFLPSIIAMYRGKSNTFAIILLNVFLGWTFVGWIVALVWSVTNDAKPQTIIVNNTTTSNEPRNDFQRVNQNFNTPQKAIGNFNSHSDSIDRLQKIKQLLDDGVLTQEEFIQQKNKILNS